MSFLIHSISNSNVVPMEYYPCATKAVVGTPMLLAEGALLEYGIGATLEDMSGIPIYISMGVKTTREMAGDAADITVRIPVIRVRDDIIFEATSKSGNLEAGNQVAIYAKVNTADKATDYDYFVENVKTVKAAPQFEVVEAKEPNAGSTVQKVLIRYIG